MASVMPLPRFQWIDANGNPLVGGKLYSYAAGTSSPLNTYTDATLATPNANPVILDASGSAAVYLSGSYKFVLKTSADVTVWTQDNVSEFQGVGSPPEWVNLGLTPTYVNANTFTVPGDVTAIMNVGRRVKVTVTAGTKYGYISSSIFSSVTTLQVVLDASASLDSGLSAVYYGIVSALNTSAPKLLNYAPAWSVHRNSVDQTGFTSGAYVKFQGTTETFDSTGIYDNSTNYRATIVTPGMYMVGFRAAFTTVNDGKGLLAAIYKNGALIAESGVASAGEANSVWSNVVDLLSLTTGEYLEAFVLNRDSVSRTVLGTATDSRFWGVMIL